MHTIHIWERFPTFSHRVQVTDCDTPIYIDPQLILLLFLWQKEKTIFIYPIHKWLRTISPHNHILQRPTRLKIQDVGTESNNENE